MRLYYPYFIDAETESNLFKVILPVSTRNRLQTQVTLAPRLIYHPTMLTSFEFCSWIPQIYQPTSYFMVLSFSRVIIKVNLLIIIANWVAYCKASMWFLTLRPEPQAYNK